MSLFFIVSLNKILSQSCHEGRELPIVCLSEQDEDSMCNKLCTFTLTQKEFMHQHWYHCHTCRMVDGVGVCTVCARVCHRGHDVTYSKYGAFFCDCGAKEDGSCQVGVFPRYTLYCIQIYNDNTFHKQWPDDSYVQHVNFELCIIL